jgi:hypothetical protein
MVTVEGVVRMPKLVLREDAVSWAPTEQDAVVILDLRSSHYLSLNASGSVLWQKIAEGATRDELREALSDRFGLDAAHADSDVAAFLSALRSRDLVVEQ